MASKTSKTSKSSKSSVSAPVVDEQPSVVVQSNDQEVETKKESQVDQQSFDEVLLKLKSFVDTLGANYRAGKELVKLLNRSHTHEMKNRKKKKRSGGDGKKKETLGFNKMDRIPKKFRDFFGFSNEMGQRNQVTKAFFDYTNTHNLKMEGNKKNIIPDAKLMTLFGIASSDLTQVDGPDGKQVGVITFSEVQKLIKKVYEEDKRDNGPVEPPSDQNTENVDVEDVAEEPAKPVPKVAAPKPAAKKRAAAAK